MAKLASVIKADIINIEETITSGSIANKNNIKFTKILSLTLLQIFLSNTKDILEFKKKYGAAKKRINRLNKLSITDAKTNRKGPIYNITLIISPSMGIDFNR